MQNFVDRFLNNFIETGDLVEIRFDEPIRNTGYFDMIFQVRDNPSFPADKVIFVYDQKYFIYNCDCNSQDKDLQVKTLRNCIYKIYRKNAKGNYTCIYINNKCNRLVQGKADFLNIRTITEKVVK